MQKLETIFKALANKRRLHILQLLLKGRSASVGEIAEKIETSFKSTSKHLLVLFNAAFLEKRRVGGFTFYCLSDTLKGTRRLLANILGKKE